MKYKSTKTIKISILLLGVFLLFTNCEEENISDVNNISNNKINSSEIILQEITNQEIEGKNSKVTEILQRLENTKVLNKSSSGKNASNNDFYVLKNKGIYIQYRKHHSYTFPIFREKKSSVVENILVSLQRDKSYKTYLVTYSFSDEELDKIKKKIPFNTSDKMQIEEINFNVSSLFSKVAVREMKNPDGTCNRYTETTGPLGYPVTQVESGVPCSDSSGGGSTSGETTSGGDTGSQGGNGDGGDGGDDGFGSGSYGGGVTTPLTEGVDADSMASELRTKLSLSGGTYLWLKNNPYIVIMIDEFLQDNQNSIQAKNFAKEIINYCKANPSVDFNDVFYNRTSLDTDSSSDLNNNSSGGFDNTSYSTFNPQQQEWPTIQNIISVNQFVGWGAAGIKRNCMDYAKAQIAKKGYQISNYGVIGQTFQIYTEQSGVNQANLENGLSYLKYALSNNIPVIVGVDDNPGNPGNPDNSTDHFIVIIGMGSNSNGNYFQFYDNASGNVSQGTNPLNLLYYNSSTHKISGKSQCSGYFNNVSHDYIITQIRKSKIKL